MTDVLFCPDEWVVVKQRSDERVLLGFPVAFELCPRCCGSLAEDLSVWGDPYCVSCGEVVYRTPPPADPDEDDYGWTLEWDGDQPAIRETVRVDLVLNLLSREGPLQIAKMAESLPFNRDYIDAALWKLKNVGVVEREKVLGRNAYVWRAL